MDGGEGDRVLGRHMFRGGPRAQAAGYRRVHAAARGCQPPPASKQKRHQHNKSRFDPPTSDRLVDWGIPYQCFSASSRLASCVPLSALAFSLQAMQQVASTFQRGRWQRVD